MKILNWKAWLIAGIIIATIGAFLKISSSASADSVLTTGLVVELLAIGLFLYQLQPTSLSKSTRENLGWIIPLAGGILLCTVGAFFKIIDASGADTLMTIGILCEVVALGIFVVSRMIGRRSRA